MARLIQLGIYVDVEQLDRLTALARVKGVSRNALVRDAIAAYLAPPLPIAGGGGLRCSDDDVDHDAVVDSLDRAVQRLIEEEHGWPAR